MGQHDSFTDRRHALEEEYFRKREQELIAKLHERAAAGTDFQEMREQTGITNKELLADLHALGYTHETVTLLHLVPLVQVAWAEGGVSDQELALILAAARARGIADASPAGRQLAEWLATRPPDSLFETTLRAIRTILQVRPAAEREAAEADLLSHCLAIAEVSGGILGIGRVSDAERQILQHISEVLARRTAST